MHSRGASNRDDGLVVSDEAIAIPSAAAEFREANPRHASPHGHPARALRTDVEG